MWVTIHYCDKTFEKMLKGGGLILAPVPDDPVHPLGKVKKAHQSEAVHHMVVRKQREREGG